MSYYFSLLHCHVSVFQAIPVKRIDSSGRRGAIESVHGHVGFIGSCTLKLKLTVVLSICQSSRTATDDYFHDHFP